MFGVFFYVSLYMQHVLGYSPIQAGASFLPMTLLIILLAPHRRAGCPTGSARGWLDGGRDDAARGLALLFSRLGADSSFWDAPARHARRRRRHVADDDADDRGRDELGAAWTRPASARPC